MCILPKYIGIKFYPFAWVTFPLRVSCKREKHNAMDRKEFLTLIGSATAGALIVSCIGGCKSESVSASVDFTLDLNASANASLKNKGGYVVSNGIIVAQTTGGEYIAVSAACTHEGATVGFSNGQFVCPRHGAVFSATSGVVSGPASRPLTQYKTALSGSTLRIYS